VTGAQSRVRDRTSIRARWCLGVLVVGYLAVAVLAGTVESPLTTPLPAGASPPGWVTRTASALGFRHEGRLVVVVALAVVATMLVAFVLLLIEARANRVRLSTILVAAGVSLLISVAAPLLLSRDVFSYAVYGRIFALYHDNPYVAVPASFRRDPFVGVTSQQWLHTRSLYGPVFTLASAGIVRAWDQSPGATILAFKALAGLSLAAATILTARAAVALRPERAAMAAAIVGLNPVLVVHTVGGGHTDALIAVELAGALALAVTTPHERGSWLGLRGMGVTVLLTLATLTKVVIVPLLVLWLWWMVKVAPPRERVKAGGVHLAVVVVLSAALLAPFWAGAHTFAPLATLAGVEGWASPARLVARGARAVVGSIGGSRAGAAADKVVVASFLLVFAALFWQLRPRQTNGDGFDLADVRSLVEGWGSASLLMALAAPYLLPWYVAWFVPFLGLMSDDGLMWIGVAVAALLALTLIPADPFRGYTTWGVMVSVHYVVAPFMLALFIVAATRVVRDTQGNQPAPLPAGYD
jgi:hypothetical protein